MTRIILASASRSRKTMLHAAGITCDVLPADVDEAAIRASLGDENLSAEDVAQILAEAKADCISAHHPGSFVIAADQILVFDGNLFSKPASVAAAYTQLWALRGKTHQLYSALACMRDGQTTLRHVARADLTMRKFSKEFLNAYLQSAGEQLLSSVGAYQLEGHGAQLFEKIEGDYFTILGLPLLALLAHLRDQDLLTA